MKNNRRDFLKTAAVAGAMNFMPQRSSSSADKSSELAAKIDKVWAEPALKTDFFKQPVKIASIELLQNGKYYLVRVRSTDGAEGLAAAHDSVMATTYPIFVKRIAPYFIGRDARNLEDSIHGVYLKDSNYKWQGLPFWVCVASLEVAVLDLLGKVANKPIGELLGGVVRKEIAVYRASGNRGNSPEEEIDYLKKIVAETGAKAIKFRLGARMRYDEASTKRDHALIPLTRKTFGDRMTIYADANGSYDIPMAVKIGRMMEDHKLAFFEEPVPFDYYDETKRIADTLAIPIAGGEQESSLRRFRWMIENDCVQIECDTSSLKSENGVMKIPLGPGLGVKFDPGFISKAVTVSA
jgi:L-alanine-DL-glutamate epimerase-like enolase superfamily enzyme